MPNHILIVDDTPIILEQLTTMITQLGHTPIVAENGQKALDQLDIYPDVALIILDYQMPYMDGVEFLSVKSTKKALANIPVCMYSRISSSHPALQHAYTAGYISCFLPKPTGFDALKEVVNRYTWA